MLIPLNPILFLETFVVKDHRLKKKTKQHSITNLSNRSKYFLLIARLYQSV